jgi:alpha-galactosidase
MDEFAGLDKGWNDPDMMVIGMGGISTLQSKTHMTMWSMMNSPIMLGFDLRRVTKGDDLLNIIANKDIVDLNQDPLGIQAKRIYCSASSASANPDTTYLNSANDNLRIDVLAKPLANGDVALSFINVGASGSRTASVDVNRIIQYIGSKMVNAQTFNSSDLFFIKDLWTKEVSL